MIQSIKLFLSEPVVELSMRLSVAARFLLQLLPLRSNASSSKLASFNIVCEYSRLLCISVRYLPPFRHWPIFDTRSRDIS